VALRAGGMTGRLHSLAAASLVMAALAGGSCGTTNPSASPGGPLATITGSPSAATPIGGAASASVAPSGGPCALPALREQVALLLLVAIPGTVPDSTNLALVRQGVGGMLLFGPNVESADQVRQLIEGLQAEAAIPLIVAVDEEPGRIARLAGAGILPATPSARVLGSRSAEQVRAVGRQIGAGLTDLGFTVDLAPVLDVTGAAAAGVIGDRSFGSDPAVVSRAGVAFLEGLREGGVAAVGKHFPGHGETTVDSHADLPVVPASVARLRARALPPFRTAIEHGLRAVMVGHLLVRAIDPERPASLSRAVIGDLLRGELGFDGLVVSDALEMGALTAYGDLPTVVELAIDAGIDLAILSGPTRVTDVIDELERAVEDGRLPASRVRDAFLRVERFKGVSDWDACAG
jgi:beta-N-acetylhexosaminidase